MGSSLLPTPSVNSIYTGGATASSVALPLISTATVPDAARTLPACNLTMGLVRNQPCR